MWKIVREKKFCGKGHTNHRQGKKPVTGFHFREKKFLWDVAQTTVRAKSR